jgi:hypothetical protein
MKLKIFLLLILLIIIATLTNAAGLSSARAVAMGGAYMGLAKGVYAPLYNPGNIGIYDYQQRGLELAGAGVEIRNNSFTLDDYNKYTGATLSDEDKSVILGKIPADGLQVSALAEAGAATLSLGSFVFSFNGYAATETDINKDILSVLLDGNELNQSINLNGNYSEAIAYASGGISYGRSIYISGTRQIGVGATVKYIKGIAYEKITEIRGDVVTLATGFEGEGTMIARTSTGGSGFGMDIGATLKFNDNYTAGITFENIISNIGWSNETQEHYYIFHFDTLTMDNMDEDSIIVSDDYSEDVAAFNTNLPCIMRIGIANTSGNFIWAVDWTQGFKLAAGSSSKPRLSAGVEYRPTRFLPLRGGYSLGGGRSSVLSGGLGVDLGLYYLDLAVANHSLFKFAGTKGIHVAISTGLRF